MDPFRTENITEITREFDILGTVGSITEIKTGQVKNAYRVCNNTPEQPDYLLQRINHQLFKNVPALMQNILRVTEHMKAKLPVNQSLTHVITLVKLKDGGLFHKDHYGNYWRMFRIIGGTKSYDKVGNTDQAYQSGLAFGGFQSMLSDLDTNELHDTLPGLHDVKYRLDYLEEAWNNNLSGRAADVRAEIDFISEREAAMCEILRLGDEDLLPWRVTHNDAKFSNVLFDAGDKAQFIRSLDTIMPGYIAYDFGEAIRTIFLANDDEADLDKIKIDIPLFEAYTRGYLKKARYFLTDIELKSLIMGVMLMPFIWAVRYLTDHLNGDIEFKTQLEGQNLQRARLQIMLLMILEKAEQELQLIIDRI